MFKNSYQKGLLSIFYSVGSDPLSIWDSNVHNGHIKRLTDDEVNSLVLEIVSTNVATTYIVCPKGNQFLGIKLPYLVMIIKNLKRYFSFEVTILDDKNMRRRFRTSNYQSATKIKPFCTTMPIGLTGGWNQVQFNLADFTRRAYGSQYIETLKVQIHANTRVRRIYFSEMLYTEDQLPNEYKLYLPLKKKDKKPSYHDIQEAPPIPSAPLVKPPETAVPIEPEIEVVMEPASTVDKVASRSSKASIVSAAKPTSLKTSVISAAAGEDNLQKVAEETETIAEGEEIAESPVESAEADEEGVGEINEGAEISALDEEAPTVESPAEEVPPEETSADNPPETEEANAAVAETEG